MKVLHVSTYSWGGAAIAALRLHSSLLDLGVDSKFLCLYKSEVNVQQVYKFEQKYRPFYKRLLNRFGLFIPKSVKNQIAIKSRKGIFENFSFPTTDHLLHEHPLIKEADIINLHWVSNFLDIPSFFKNVNKPIVWTFHDANPILGGFHLEEDVMRNEIAFGTLENKFRKLKESALSVKNNIIVVTPSNWLSERSHKSLSFKNKHHFVIPNGIDETVFQNYNKELATQVWNGKRDSLKLLFVSQSLDSKNKGFDLLTKALNYLDLDDIELWAIGEINDEIKNTKIKYLGTIQDERLMALAYSAADAFIIPSRNENLPNVMLEALACGTPIISFKIGGMAEVIEDGFNGLFAKEISPQGLANAILSFVNTKEQFNRITIREHALKRFTLTLQSKAYYNIYNSLLKNDLK